MKKQFIKLPEISLVGLVTRTNNKNEIDSTTAKIAPLANSYWGSQMADKIKSRKEPGITYAAYTDFESDENGDYTYFIGESVNSIRDQDLAEFRAITIPQGHYLKFTTNPGKMPDIVISSWQKIWTMTEKDFGGKRKYITDFEVYDQRAADPNNMVIDIYIGIEI